MTAKELIKLYNRVAAKNKLPPMDPNIPYKGKKQTLEDMITKLSGKSVEETRQEYYPDYSQALKEAEAKLPPMTAKTKTTSSVKIDAAAITSALEKKKLAPTVVAHGAYESETEALYKTGHTTQGKVGKAPVKSTPKKTTAPKKATNGSGSTAEAAKILKTEPKKLRDKLRKLGHNAPYGSVDWIVKTINAAK